MSSSSENVNLLNLLTKATDVTMIGLSMGLEQSRFCLQVFRPQPTGRVELSLPSSDDLTRVAAKATRVIISLGTSAGLITTALLGQPWPTLAEGIREFDILGTLDCGQRSGRRCHIADWNREPVVGIYTQSLSGNNERAPVKISWLRSSWEAFDQDDLVWVTVLNERDSQGRFQATRVLRYLGDGTDNQGLSTGSKKYPEKGRDPKKNH